MTLISLRFVTCFALYFATFALFFLRIFGFAGLVLPTANEFFPIKRMCRAPPAAGGALPLGPVASSVDLARAAGEQTKDEWRAMALASGWTPEFQKKKALETAFGSMFISLGTEVGS